MCWKLRSISLQVRYQENSDRSSRVGAVGMVYLNRQVIVLLENMGVKQHTFLHLQNQARLKISMSLLANKTAERVLGQQVRCYDWEQMRSTGIHLTQEPFARSLLLMLAKDR